MYFDSPITSARLAALEAMAAEHCNAHGWHLKFIQRSCLNPNPVCNMPCQPRGSEHVVLPTLPRARRGVSVPYPVSNGFCTGSLASSTMVCAQAGVVYHEYPLNWYVEFTCRMYCNETYVEGAHQGQSQRLVPRPPRQPRSPPLPRLQVRCCPRPKQPC